MKPHIVDEHQNSWLNFYLFFAVHQTRDGGGMVPQSPWFWLLVVWCGHQHTAELRGPVRARCGSGG